MDKYLIEQYGVIEDKKWLKDVSDIEDYFEDIARDYMDCGQGYYQDEVDFICKIGDKFYIVDVCAEIGSAKQDVGDRLYWVDSITSVSYREIEKPKPKNVKRVMLDMELTDDQERSVISFLNDNNITRI